VIEPVQQWFRRRFSDPQVVILAGFLLVFFAVIILFGGWIGPVLAAVVFAYLLDYPVELGMKLGMPRWLAVSLVFVVFLALLAAVLFGLLPILSHQISQFFTSIPMMVDEGQKLLMTLPAQYPELISVEQVNELSTAIRRSMTEFGQNALAQTLSWIPGLVTLLIYLILVPLLVLFMLKDKQELLLWFKGLLPREYGLSLKVWNNVDDQIANYVRGKFWEILIVGVATWVGFAVFGLEYAVLLAALVGISVLVPYIGATVVTIPVAIVAFFQFGWTAELAWVMGIYAVIQALDGNVLVPLLFSEVVNLHPIAIIVAVLFFGGLWGFWGVFFAIPLATLVKAVMDAWPREARSVQI
jgi:putative permease